MAQGPGFALRLGIILAIVMLAVAITWAAPPIRDESAASIPIYQPQHLLLY
jgi:hypothetical protein